MKRVLVFLGLKVAEVGAFIFIPYWIAKLGEKFGLNYPFADTLFDYWSIGFLMIIVPVGVIMVLLLVVLENWNWAGKITRRNK